MIPPQVGVPMDNLNHFFRGAFSIDIVLICFRNKKLKVLLQEKTDLPGQKEWGLPGKLMLPNEDTHKAMDIFMDSLIGTSDFFKKQVGTFSDLGRHPLGRVISFAFYGLIPEKTIENLSSASLKWVPIKEAKNLSYDHDEILGFALSRFQKGLLRHPRVFELLPEEFILPDIIRIYEMAFEMEFDMPNFRGRILKSQLVEPTGEYLLEPYGQGRPPMLYRFNKSKAEENYKEQIRFNF